MISVLILLVPVAITFSFIYLFELSIFLKVLKRESEDLWERLGSPTLGRATRSVAIPLLFGRFPSLDSLRIGQRQRALRLRVYLIGLLVFYAVWIIAIAFRRQLGWNV